MQKNKKLYWLRNVHCEKAKNGRDDFFRQPSTYGRKQGEHLCAYFKTHQEIRPKIIFCSTALRCRETWKIIATVIPETSVIYHHFLYKASGYTVLELLSFLEDKIDSVMVIGHGKALSDLPVLLALEKKHKDARIHCHHGTFVQVNFEPDIHWHEVNFKKGVVCDIFYP